jgi:hypothetical protein
MIKVGRGGRLWLKGFHEVFFILWIGGAVSEITIQFLTGNAENGTQLHAFYLAMKSLDIFLIPCAALTLISGLLITWLGGWGFKRFFVVYSLGITILGFVLGAVILSPSKDTMASLSDTLGLQALQNPDYQKASQLFYVLQIIELVLLISAAFISILKPLKNVFSATKNPAVSENI